MQIADICCKHDNNCKISLVHLCEKAFHFFVLFFNTYNFYLKKKKGGGGEKKKKNGLWSILVTD